MSLHGDHFTVQRGGAVSAVFGCTGGTSSSRCKCSWPRTSTTPPTGTDDGQERGVGTRCTTRLSSGRTPLPRRQAPSTLPWTSMRCLPPGRGLTASLASGRRSGTSSISADQIVDTAPALPILDVPVPLVGEQLVDVLRFFDTLCSVAEQVIDVPKISLEDILAQRLCREPQLVEQLVEVPTVVSYSSLLQRTVEQHVDNPVPGGRGRLAGLQGSSPGQSSTAFVEQIGHIPGGGLQGFRPRQGSTAFSSYSPTGSDDDADEPGIGFFRTFPRLKKSAKVTSHSSQRVLRSVCSSELSAHQMPRAGPAAHSRPSDERTTFVDDHDHAWVRMDTVHGSYWKNLDTQHSQWHPPWEG